MLCPRSLSPLSVLFLLAALAGQTADPVVVVARASGNPTTALWHVDLATGAVQALPRFANDGLLPVAVAVDAVNRDLVVALAASSGTRLVRLAVRGTTLLRETVLADLPVAATALAQALDAGFVLSAPGAAGGLWFVPRNGGTPRQIAVVPHATALQVYGPMSTYAVVAQSETATTDPGMRWVDLTTGQTVNGPFPFPGHAAGGFTGVADLPTGAVRVVFSQGDGTVTMSFNFGNPTPLPLSPRLPPGGTTALQMRGLDGIVLGDASHPFLEGFTVLGGTGAWRRLAGPIAGDPVGFVFRPPVSAATMGFGRPCAAMMLHEDERHGPPSLGNASYGLTLDHARPLTAAVFVLSATDQDYLGLPLPVVLPGGCFLHVGTEIVAVGLCDSFGVARLTIGIPSVPVLLGSVAFAQAAQLTPTLTLDTSDAVAITIGN